MLAQVLNEQGAIGVAAIKAAIEKYSATGETADSVRYESTLNTLQIFGRKFISAMETGRAPRESNQDGGFKNNMLKYMQAKGIGSNLSAKKRENLAKFLVLKINREGDKLWQRGGGRDVYSSVVDRFVNQLIEAVKKDQLDMFNKQVVNSLKGIK